MEPATQELAVNCMISPENNFINIKKRPYMIITRFHNGCSSKLEKHRTELDARGSATFQLKDVNVESDYLRFQVFNRRKWFFPDNHVGTVNILVSELVSSSTETNRKINQKGSATYEIVKSLWRKNKKADLKLLYKLSMAQAAKSDVESKDVDATTGNDAGLSKMFSSFRTPFVSLTLS